MRAGKKLGDRVKRGETLAVISDPMGFMEEPVVARASGIVIGRTNLPVINRGDGLFHIALVANLADAEGTLLELEQGLENDPLFDGMGIV